MYLIVEMWVFNFLDIFLQPLNDADLFSQPPSLLFTKGAKMSGRHCS